MVPPHCHATNDAVGNNNMITKMMHMFFACVWVHACIYMCVCPVLLWSDTRCSRVVLPIRACRLPPLSFYRKLIGSFHRCVKLLCVGQCRQLDYLFFIFSILEQLPSALLLFLNEILFPSVALKDTVCNCSKPSHSWRFAILFYYVCSVHILLSGPKELITTLLKW